MQRRINSLSIIFLAIVAIIFPECSKKDEGKGEGEVSLFRGNLERTGVFQRGDPEKLKAKIKIVSVASVLKRELAEKVVAVGEIKTKKADVPVMEAEVIVDEADVVKVKKGMKAVIQVDALPEVKIMGTVTEIGNFPIVPMESSTTNSSASREFKTMITLKSIPPTLKPGFSVTADIITEEKTGCLSIPMSALIIRKSSNLQEKEICGVFLIDNDRAKFREVKTGFVGDMFIEIISGLKENEQIIIGPFKTLRELNDSDPVRVENPEKVE